MPGKVKKKKNKRYVVKWGGKTVAKNTTKVKAKKQLKLLRAIEHGWRPTKNRKRKK